MSELRIYAGISGLTGVAAGAFGAHALQSLLTTRNSLPTWQTAVLYHLIHSIAILLAAIALENPTLSIGAQRRWRRAGVAWFLGILLFSGSLYSLALGGPRWLGPITPIGGVAFLAGWCLVTFSGRSSRP